MKTCTLCYQVVGEEIPSLVNDEYNVQVIQYYDFELSDIKRAKYIANIYQDIIKSPCVLRLHDYTKEIYSLALKRLNQVDKKQIVVTDVLLTSEFYTSLNDSDKRKFTNYVEVNNIIAKENKMTTYLEMYVKAYILSNNKLYQKSNELLDNSKIWYSERKVRNLYACLIEVSQLKNTQLKTTNNTEKIKINKNIKSITRTIEELIT